MKFDGCGLILMDRRTKKNVFKCCLKFKLEYTRSGKNIKTYGSSIVLQPLPHLSTLTVNG